MKYRRLDLAELQHLESDFIRFLASNHITAEDWQKLKKENKDKVDRLVDIYSDIVWERTLPTVQYLEFVNATDCKAFYCTDNHIQLIGMSIDKSTGIDLRNHHLVTTLPDIAAQYGQAITYYQSKKLYQKERNQEVFDLLESGCLIAQQGHLFQLLTAMEREKNNY